MAILSIGITGGIGAGKSAVSQFLSAEGYQVLNADQISREITAKGSPAIEEIMQAFGTECVDSQGNLNRAELRKRISQNEADRKKLEAILHPKIQASSKAKMDALERKGERIVFYEAPLLFEANSDRAMDAVICVYADDAIRVQRVVARDKVKPEEALALLRAQMSQTEKMQRSQFKLPNNGTLEDLHVAIKKMLPEILKLKKK